MECIRGTLHVAIDTNFNFVKDFSGRYRSKC